MLLCNQALRVFQFTFNVADVGKMITSTERVIHRLVGGSQLLLVAALRTRAVNMHQLALIMQCFTLSISTRVAYILITIASAMPTVFARWLFDVKSTQNTLFKKSLFN